jgi:Cu+-exporting ATPase
MTCSACSSGIERSVGKLDGVSHVEVSLMGKCMNIEYDECILNEDKIFDCVRSLGYGIYTQESAPKQKDEQKAQDKRVLIRLILSVCLLVPLLYVSMGHMIGAPIPFFIDPASGNGHWFALYQAILTLIIVVLNFSFFTRGVKALFKRVPNMDTLVALGSGVSFIYSIVLTVLTFIGKYNGDMAMYEMHMQLHYESAATILTLVTVGKWLEEKSKRKTGEEIEKLLQLAPDSVTIEENGEQRTISIKDVKVGDILIVKQGDYIPVDGVIVSGHTFLDKSAITGESLPVEVVEGDFVTTAALNKSQPIKLKAQKIGEDTTLSKIVKMVKEAGASKAPIQKFADKVAGVFVPAVTAIALFTFIIWMLIDGAFVPEHCVTYAISVLVVSCPCALGLATPVAIMTATGKGASLGILYKDAESLQKVSQINCVLLDKTATITEGKPKVTDVLTYNCDKNQVIKIACGIESNSNHPLAKCILEYSDERVNVENFNYIIGKGATAEYNGKKYFLGNIKLLGGIKIDNTIAGDVKSLESNGKTVMYLATENRVLALIAVADNVKQGSKQAIALLKKRGIKVAMLTGDSQVCAKAVADSVGIDDFIVEVMPEDKLKSVKNLQAAGGVVAMVGDGINDSPALKQADIGIAIGSGTDVAIDSADVVLVNTNLQTLDTVIDLSHETVKNIKQNLFWAFFYNIVMIPVAAGVFAWTGWLTFNPMWAALCMSLSSLFVVFNALRLLTYKNKKIIEVDSSMKKVVSIEGMCCEHCAARVEKALSAVTNVISADVKLKKNLAIVRSREEVSDEEIKSVVEQAGYKVTTIENK